MEVCTATIGAADDRIVELAEPGDIVICRDLPLAHRLVQKNIAVLDDRGRIFTSDNIKEHLSIRNFVVDLAETGLGPERIAQYGKKEVQLFAASFDMLLTRSLKK
jgi:uncharacterized protein YaiI (UPF0178 family)